jgi:hypothetical protein
VAPPQRTVAIVLLALAIPALLLTQMMPFKAATLYGAGYGMSPWSRGGTGDFRFYWEGCGTDAGCDPTAASMVGASGVLLALATVVACFAVAQVGRGKAARALAITAASLTLVALVLLFAFVDQVKSGLGLSYGAWAGLLGLALAVAACVVVPPPAPLPPLPPAVEPPSPFFARPAPAAAPAAVARTAPAPARAATAPPPGTRFLKCPRCATVIAVPPGTKPVCGNCGFA